MTLSGDTYFWYELNFENLFQEIATSNLLLHLYPHLKVYLVKLSDVVWDTNFKDASRAAYHEKKMSSKKIRSDMQMGRLQIPNGFVMHIEA